MTSVVRPHLRRRAAVVAAVVGVAAALLLALARPPESAGPVGAGADTTRTTAHAASARSTVVAPVTDMVRAAVRALRLDAAGPAGMAFGLAGGWIVVLALTRPVARRRVLGTPLRGRAPPALAA